MPEMHVYVIATEAQKNSTSLVTSYRRCRPDNYHPDLFSAMGFTHNVISKCLLEKPYAVVMAPFNSHVNAMFSWCHAHEHNVS